MQSILFQKKKNALAALYTGDSVAFRNYLESLQLRIKGQWREAGDTLIKCAESYYALKMMIETATLYYDAAECYLRVDKSEALLALKKSVKAYCDIVRFDVAGTIERKIAEIHYRILHWEDAYNHFKKSADFFSGDRDLDQSDRCLDYAAECAIQIGKYEEARQIYEAIAKSCVNTNLRRFQSTKKLLKAIFCMMGKSVFIEDEIPIVVSKKKKKDKDKDKKNKSQTQETTTAAPPVAAITAGGSVEGGMSSVTSRTSIEDDNSSINTAETKPPGVPPAPVPEKTSINLGDNNSTVDHSSNTAKTSYTQNDGDQQTLNALSFMGMEEQQIQAKLPKDATYYHHLPKEFKFQMQETVRMKYTEIADVIVSYEYFDSFWKCSKERYFLDNLMKFREESNYFDFIDHLYYWNNVYPLDEVSLILLKIPVQELEKERENSKIARLNVEVNNAIRGLRQTTFSMK
jgi:hypothetical protein